jgi:hypothetical protein
METTKGNSLCSYLYLKLEKMSCFSFNLLYFFLYKLENKRVEQVLQGERVWHQWEAVVVGKGVGS